MSEFSCFKTAIQTTLFMFQDSEALALQLAPFLEYCQTLLSSTWFIVMQNLTVVHNLFSNMKK